MALQDSTPISGPIITAKGKQFSICWVSSVISICLVGLFVLNNATVIHKVGLHDENLSSDLQTADNFQSDFEKCVSTAQLSCEQIYNADES